MAEDLLGVSPTLAVAVGTAAGMASMTGHLLLLLLFSALLVASSNLDTVPAAVFAAAAARITIRSVDRRAELR